MGYSLSMPNQIATNIKKCCDIHYCYTSRARDKCELRTIITLVLLAAGTKVMAVGQLAGSVSVSYHAATFTVCTCMTSRLPGDPQPPSLMCCSVHGVNAPTGCWLSSPKASDACCLCLAAIPVEELGPYSACQCHVFALLRAQRLMPLNHHPPGISVGTPGLAGLH